ncbi:hypothetical protein D3C78_1552920 [compost metagenome]
MSRRFLSGDENAAHVDGQGAVEVLQAERFQRPEGQYAGIVDQDVEPTEGCHCCSDGLTNGRSVCAVSQDRQGVAPGCVDVLLQFIGLGCRADIGEGYGGALIGQALHDGRADAARAALNQCYFASEVCLGRHSEMLRISKAVCLADGASIDLRLPAV